MKTRTKVLETGVKITSKTTSKRTRYEVSSNIKEVFNQPIKK